jgi:hypothetical protein
MYAPAPFMDCVLFGSSGLADRFSWVFRLQTEANALEFCLKNQWDNYNGARLGTNAEIPAAPMWTLPAGLMLQNLPVASYRSNLYLLAGHSETREIAGPRNAVVPGQPAGRNQYNGKLLCFSPGSNVPQTLFLKFDPPDAAAQMDGLSPYSRQLPPRTWMLFGGNFLFFGNDNAGDKSGLWFIPVPQLEAAIATEGQRISRVESSY